MAVDSPCPRWDAPKRLVRRWNPPSIFKMVPISVPAARLKALLAKINSDGEAYKVSRQKYVTEKKNFEYRQKKYELGMISAIQLQQAELQLKQAEMTNMQNGYQFYLDWQKYYAAEKGVDMSNF